MPATFGEAGVVVGVILNEVGIGITETKASLFPCLVELFVLGKSLELVSPAT
jgi:hypothetical protein